MNKTLELLKEFPKTDYATDDIVMKEGQPKGSLYILIDGEVEILKQDIHINSVDSPGSIFGEVSILMDFPHMATVKTLKPSRFYVVENPLDFLIENPEIHLHLTTLLARRLNSITNYLVDMKNQFDHRDDHLGMVDDVLEALLHQQSH